MIKKQFFFALVFIANFHCIFGQTDSIKKNHLSINLASGLISGEVGFFFDRKIRNEFAIQVSYGHRFYNFNIIQNGGSGLGYKYLPQTADIIRIGLKKFIRTRRDDGFKSVYITSRLSYWNLHTPKYCNRHGSNGYNGILRETVSVDKNWGNISVGIGKEFYPTKHLYFDIFYSAGASIGQKKVHLYSYGNSGSCDSNLYPNNTFRKSLSFSFTIELGCKMGISW